MAWRTVLITDGRAAERVSIVIAGFVPAHVSPLPFTSNCTRRRRAGLPVTGTLRV